jgi:hypothetical protein
MLLRFVLPLLFLAAPALGQQADGATQLAGLFTQACLAHAGNPAALRQWAAQFHLPAVPPEHAAAFLRGGHGQVFDASNRAGKFVVVSDDSGACGSFTDRATASDVLPALRAQLRPLGITLAPAASPNAASAPEMAFASFTLRLGQQQDLLVIGTSKDGGDAMIQLTAAPGPA